VRAQDSPTHGYCEPNQGEYSFSFSISPGGPVSVITRPNPGTYSSCPDENLEIYISDPDGVDLTTIRLTVNTETIVWGDPRLSYRDSDSTLIFEPSPPFADGMIVNATLLSVEDLLGNAAENLVSWSFTMDLSAPIFNLVQPLDTAYMIYNTRQPISVSFSDAISGVDTSSLTFSINGNEISRSKLSITYNHSIRTGNIAFIRRQLIRSFQRVIR
jgi:hypothetical protein